MDFWANILPMLTGGGGGSPGLGTLPLQPSSPVPYSGNDFTVQGQGGGGGMPSLPGVPSSSGPVPTGPPPTPPPSSGAPEIDFARKMLGIGQPLSGGGVPYPSATNMPGSMGFGQGMPTDLGSALEPAGGGGSPAPGVPIPQPRPGDLGQGNYGGSPETNPNLRPIGSPAGQIPGMPGAMSNFQKALGQVKAPAPPDIVKPGQAPVPTAHPVQASQLMALLQSIMPGLGRGLRMPTTLGQALELKPGAWGPLYG